MNNKYITANRISKFKPLTWLVIFIICMLIASVLAGCVSKPTPNLSQDSTPISTSTSTPTPSIPLSPPAPSTPTPSAGFYQNTAYGFSLHFPTSWIKKDTGQREPVVEIRDPQQFPLILISVNYISTQVSLKEQATSMLSGRREGLAEFSKLNEGDIAIGDLPAYSIEYAWKSRTTPAKGRLVILLRGAQLYQFDIISPTSSYDSQKDTIDSIINSFRLEEARPFGIPRNNALTLTSDGPHTLDPSQSRELLSHSFVTQVFSGLVAYDKDMNLIPDIAERWVISPDGRKYTFFLKKNVRFHNSRPLKASDVKYSWERASQPQTGSQTAATYLGDIVGVREMLAGKARELSGVKVIDDYTLEVTIDAPKAYFLAKLFYPVAYIVDRNNVESGGKEWWRQPNGTGPFKLRQWLPDELFMLERNPDYYREPSSLSYIIFRLFSGIPMMMYENGDIDIVNIGGGNIDRAQDAANPLHKELKIVPELSLFYIGFNHTRPPFDDPLVRMAFAQAIDKKKIVSRVHRNTLPKADGIIPSGMPGYNPDLQILPFDPSKARASLAASRYKNVSGLPPITITLAGEGGDVSEAIGAVIDQWRVNLGVDVKVRQLEPRVYYYNLKQEKDEMYDSGWIADYPDPQNFLDILFRSGGEENSGGYSNTSLDAMLDTAAIEMDVNKRKDTYRQAEQKLINDAAIIPLWYGRSYMLVKPYVKGYVVTPLGIPIFSEVTLEPH